MPITTNKNKAFLHYMTLDVCTDFVYSHVRSNQLHTLVGLFDVK